MDIFTEATLTGIVPPAQFMAGKESAEAKLEGLQGKVEAFKARRREIAGEVEALKAEGAQALAAGEDVRAVQTKVNKLRQEEQDLAGWIAEVEKLLPEAKAAVSQAAKVVKTFLLQELHGARVEMLRQLDAAMYERAKMLNTTRDGYVFSCQPDHKRQAMSKIAVCEVCKQPIALINPETIGFQVMGSMFKPIGGADSPFHPAAAMEFLRCPRCGKRPWGEFRDSPKILVSDGFLVIKAPEPEQAETSEQAEE